ncbi:MAG: hypothetical protein JNN30_13195 [Rhodanobacteraceae bacterium]|nr:hypothetical protein [Rhodanobacteraceae bacterium]
MSIYVGSGQPQARYDVAHGEGVWVSRDAGASWTHAGLAATRHIGAILIDPADPNIALAAALGPYYAESADRGVYRTTDGGAHWTRTLSVDDASGAVDLAADPRLPRTVFAATWTARNYPWMSYFTPMVGTGSGLHRSDDGGITWRRLRGGGWPEGPLGRIGVAVALHDGKPRVYALVDHAVNGGLYRSDDGGANWSVVQKDTALTTRYFARLTVHPDDPDTIYLMGRSMRVSHDAGRTLSFFRGSPGGDDYHDLWINPRDPRHMVAASDQGTLVSSNGGGSWSDWYNQPTGQFYCLHVDNQFPYRLYAGQQDNGSVMLRSRSDYGAISFRDWQPVGADERDCVVPDPADPQIVYGSGLGGRVSRYDARTGDVQNITPVPVNTYGRDPRTVEDRWSWITPLTGSSQDPFTLYLGSQYLYRSSDRGASWQKISPDLTGRTRDSQSCAGQVALADARACGFGVIFSIAPSPHSADEVWIGTDSGLIQRTRDGGKSWDNLTPPALPEWGTVARIDPSPLNRDVIYAAVDLHRANRFEPLLLKTRDGGKSWITIDNGLPSGEFTAVVRADPKQDGLLYAGTDRGVYFSIDDGAQWQPLQNGLPVAWVRDLRVVGNDLAIATQGRALWILDGVNRLRDLAADQRLNSPTLFSVADAVRLRKNMNKDTPLAAEVPLGRNPPTGALIEYYLPKNARRLVLRVRDASGALVRQFASDTPDKPLPAEQYFSDLYRNPAKTPPTAAGAHRFVWNLRHERPLATAYEYSIAATAGVETDALPQGPLALPGRYRIELEVDGKALQREFNIRLDPRLSLSDEELRQILRFNLDLAAALKTLTTQIAADQHAMAALVQRKDDVAAERARLSARLDGDLSNGVRGLRGWMEILSAVAADAESAERVPTTAQLDLLRQFTAALAPPDRGN